MGGRAPRNATDTRQKLADTRAKLKELEAQALAENKARVETEAAKAKKGSKEDATMTDTTDEEAIEGGKAPEGTTTTHGGHHGTLEKVAKADSGSKERPSVGAVGGLFKKLSLILRDNFRPLLGQNAHLQEFEEGWHELQGLLCAETIVAAQGLANTARSLPAAAKATGGAHTWASITAASQQPPRIQPVPQHLAREVRISRRECPESVRLEATSPATMVPMVNQAIGRFTTGKVEAARQLPSGDLIFRVDSEQTRKEMQSHAGWMESLGAGSTLSRPRFTVMVKDVGFDVLTGQMESRLARSIIKDQNPAMAKVEIIHVGRKRSSRRHRQYWLMSPRRSRRTT